MKTKRTGFAARKIQGEFYGLYLIPKAFQFDLGVFTASTVKHLSCPLLTENLSFCCLYRYGPPVRTDHRLIVENLSSRISWQVRDY